MEKTPQERQAEFIKRLTELQEELKIQLVPIIKIYPDGTNKPDIELIIK